MKRETLLKLASKDPEFRKELIASISFQVPKKEADEIEFLLGSVYGSLRELSMKISKLDPILVRKVRNLKDEVANLQASIERYINNI